MNISFFRTELKILLFQNTFFFKKITKIFLFVSFFIPQVVLGDSFFQTKTQSSTDKNKKQIGRRMYWKLPIDKISSIPLSYKGLLAQTKGKEEDWETSLEEELEKQKQLQDSMLPNENKEVEDWEKELDKELEEQEEKEEKYDNSRGFNSPVNINNNSGNRSAQNLMMGIMAAVDTVGQWDRYKPRKTENRYDVREAEFGFAGAIDQWARGSLLVAAHNEDGKYFFEVHEAFIMFPFISKYINLKAGRMFLDVGRLNRIHRHDWSFTNAPIVHLNLMDKEAIQDTGAEVSFLLPWTNLTQELVIGVMNGRIWGHAHSDGQTKNNPLGYAHLKNFYYFGNNWGTQFGFTALRFEPDKDSKQERLQYGFDAVVRWNRANLRSFLLMTEVWYRETRTDDELDLTTFQTVKTPMDTKVGFYIFAEYQFHQLWAVGYRYDFFKDPNLRDKNGYLAPNGIDANTLQITLRPSEFSYIRASVERRFTKDYTQESNQEVKEYRYYLQATFILGTHPAHQY